MHRSSLHMRIERLEVIEPRHFLVEQRTGIELGDLGFGRLDMLGELRQDNLTLVDSLKRAKAIADAAGDNASSGVIDAWTDEAEQRAWFLLESARD